MAAFLIKQTGDQVEPAEQFDKPLVHQGLRQNDQGSFGPAGQMQAVQNETGLDGFPQADFIGEEYTGLQTVGDFLSEVELMLDQINPATGEATVGGFANPGLPSEGFIADIEKMGLIQLSTHQTIERIGKTDGIGKAAGIHSPLLGMQKATLFLDLFDGTGDAIMGL